MEKVSVLILMATFNGEQFIANQIDSLIGQTFKNWKLVIRDDGSTDQTLNVINQYLKADDRVLFITTDSDQHGSCANFSSLYKWAKQNYNIDYLMFCDQDDIWLPGKISDSLQAMLNFEKNNYSIPCLAYGRLHIMNVSGQETNDEINIHYSPKFNNLIVQNPMFGCTMMLNKSLMNHISHIPFDIENHDYWVAIVAVALGKCIAIPQKIMLYRQHANNVTSQGDTLKKRIERYADNDRQLKEFKSKLKMLCRFNTEYSVQLNTNDRHMLLSFLKSFNKSSFKLIKIIIKYKLFRITLLQTVALFYVILLNFKKLSNYYNSNCQYN